MNFLENGSYINYISDEDIPQMDEKTSKTKLNTHIKF